MRNRRMLALAAAALLVPALAACGSDATSSSSSTASASIQAPDAPLPTGGADLPQTNWALTAGTWTDVSVAGAGITLSFAADDASGNAGVNTYNAPFTANPEGGLTFGPIASTMMAGDEAKMELEAQYLKTLQSVTGYSVDGELLYLFAGETQVLTFTQG